MILLYNLFLLLYKTGVSIAARWNPKAKAWVNGRSIQQSYFDTPLAKEPDSKTIWFHCASLGEFEQGRPLIETLKKVFQQRNKPLQIVLTFFSPSGYEVRKNYQGADIVLYLPLDSKKNAERFLHYAQPDWAVFVKYEFWHYYLSALQHQKIPAILVSAIFRDSQPFFRLWGGFHRNMLRKFAAIFVQENHSKELLAQLGLNSITFVAGDTRFDRVAENALNHSPLPVVERFCNKQPVLVAGSTWDKDEAVIEEWYNRQISDKESPWKLILIPHEIHSRHLAQLQTRFPEALLFSRLNADDTSIHQSNILIVDRIGILASIYLYGTACFIGGGFNKSGHHNILEAAVYCKATITGPVYKKFKESVELKKAGGSFAIRNSNDLGQILRNTDLLKAGQIAGEYVQNQKGATNRIVQWLMKNDV